MSAPQYNNPSLLIESHAVEAGKITWKSPSNLAIIKYWGKYGEQLPRNPSISLTLDHAATTTSLEYEPRSDQGNQLSLEFLFDGQPNDAFQKRIATFLESLYPIFPFLKQVHLKIDTFNSFPHSAGIASSASAMSALALCLCSLEDQLFGTLQEDHLFHEKASYIARLGSGSACRSIYQHVALWGATTVVPGSSDYFAVEVPDVDDVFKGYRDAILLVSREEKSVSSSAGHQLMENNPYAEVRYRQARDRMVPLLEALRTGNTHEFGMIAEQEALVLHALMMSSNPSYILMQPNSLNIIQKVRQYRLDTGHPVYFSLDAGPNIHLLYPAWLAAHVDPFVEAELKPLCHEGQWIPDVVGEGPEQID